LYVEGERISLIGESLDLQAERVIDAAGKYVLPGCVDPHTHLDMPFGGTTTIDDDHRRDQAPRPGTIYQAASWLLRSTVPVMLDGPVNNSSRRVRPRARERGVSRNALLLVLTLSLVATGAAAGIVFAFNGGDHSRLTHTTYVRRANAICEAYGKRLDRIPPPLDPASPGAVYESIGLALPLLREQAAKVRTLGPPRVLQAKVDRFFALTDQSLVHLEHTRRHAGRRELFPMVQSLSAFEKSRDAAKRVMSSVGVEC
jgi:hypothetical protein